jgi:VWFA-related protein
MRSKCRVWIALAALILVGTVVTARVLGADARAAREPQPGQSLTAPQQPTFRGGVTLVTTDVIVRDGNGQFVGDLAEHDFEVFEDDVRQEVASLILVHGGRVYNQLQPPPPVQEGIILPSPRPTSDTAGRVFVIFVDDLHFEASRTPRVRRVFREIADTLIHEGDLFGIVSTGPSAISLDMTYDRSLLRVAEDRIMGDGLTPSDIVEGLAGALGPQELTYRAHVAFKTAYQVVKNLAQVEHRRKAFIYLSAGYDFDPFPESRKSANPLNRLSDEDEEVYGSVPDPATDPFADHGSVFADSDLQIELSELTKAANRANVSFYTIDPRGLVAGPDINEDVPMNEWSQYVSKTRASLLVLAELTGGIAVVNQNNLEDALQRIDAETSDYYVLGYYSTNPDPTVRTRRIAVNVNREDVTIRHRRRYSLPLPVALQ